MYKTNFIKIFSLCIILCNIYAFQKQDQINTKEDFEKFVTYFKKIDKSNSIEEIIANTTKNLLYQSLDWAENKGTEDQKLTIKLLEISYLNKLKKDIEVINKAEFLLKNTKVAELKDVVYMLQDLNQAYSRTEQYNNLLNSYTLYHNLLLKHKIPSRKSSKNNRIALAYYRLRNYEKAKKYFIERGKGFIEENDYLGYSSANNDIGLCFFKMNQLDSAKFYFEKAIAIIDTKLESKKFLGFRKVIEENIASIWVSKGDYNKALPILLGEVNFSRKQQNFKRMAEAYQEVANLYYLKHEPKIAIKYIDSVFICLKKDNNPNLKEESLFLKGRTLLKLNQFNKADEVLITAEKFKDSLELVKLENQYLIAAVKFETEKKELELKKSLQKNEIDRVTKTYQKVALLLLIALLLAMYFSLRKTIKNKKIITDQKLEAENSAKEKELLLKELHHRVKNNLQVISSILELQSLKSDNKELKNILKVGQDRIHAMSLIHQQLYQNNTLSSINFKKYISTLIEHIKRSNYQESVSIQFKIDTKDFSFPVHISVPLGLIINELITNAYKHAFKNFREGEITIHLHKKIEENTYVLKVKDNGVGIKESIDFNNIDTLGLKLVKLLAKQLQGSIEYINNNGSSFLITFKDNIIV